MKFLTLGVWALLVARALCPGPAAQQYAPALETLLQGASVLLGLWALARARREGLLGARLPLTVAALAALVVLRAFWADTPREAALVARSWFADLALLPALALVARSLVGRRLILAALLATAISATLMAADEYFRLRPAQRAALAGVTAPPGSVRQALLDRLRTEDASGPYSLPAELAGASLLALPAAGALVLARGGGARWAAALLALGLGGGLWLSQVRGAFLALGLALAVLLGRPRRLATILAAVGAASLLVLAVGAWQFPRHREDRAQAVSRFIEARVDPSAAVRLEYWIAAGRMLRDAPLAGVGPGLYAARYAAYRPARAGAVQRAHNATIGFAVSFGAVGLAVAGVLGLVWWRSPAPAEPAPVEAPAEGAPGAAPLLIATLLPVAVVVLLGTAGDQAACPGVQIEYAVPAALIFLGLLRLVGDPPRLLVPALGLGLLALWLHAQIDLELYAAGIRVLAASVLVLLWPLPDVGPLGPRGRTAALAAFLTLAALVWPLVQLGAAPAFQPWSAPARLIQVQRMLALAGDRADAALARRLLDEARALAPHDPVLLAEAARLHSELDGPTSPAVRAAARAALAAQRRQRSNQPRLAPDVQAWCEAVLSP